MTYSETYRETHRNPDATLFESYKERKHWCPGNGAIWSSIRKRFRMSLHVVLSEPMTEVAEGFSVLAFFCEPRERRL